MDLTQYEADELIAIAKYVMEQAVFERTKKVSVDLLAQNGKDELILDITPSTIKINKATYQMRAKKCIPLVRLDLDGPPHKNPDDTVITYPHIHIYREGYGTKWAYALPKEFDGCKNIIDFLDKFCQYCNIQGDPFVDIQLSIYDETHH